MRIEVDDDELKRRGWLRVVMERHESRRSVMLTAVKPNRQHATIEVSDTVLEVLEQMSPADVLAFMFDRLAEAPTVDSYREHP